jgi:hypothetical protein
VIVPRFLTRLIKGPEEMPLSREVWGDSRISIPDEIVGDDFHNFFTEETLKRVEKDGQVGLAFHEIFAHFSVAMFERK